MMGTFTLGGTSSNQDSGAMTDGCREAANTRFADPCFIEENTDHGDGDLRYVATTNANCKVLFREINLRPSELRIKSCNKYRCSEFSAAPAPLARI